MPQQKLFLERKSYRMRRLMDAVRLVPVLGLGLWLLPLMWSQPADPGGGVQLSTALTYLFGVWIGLVAAVFLLWLRTRAFTDQTLGQAGTPPTQATDDMDV